MSPNQFQQIRKKLGLNQAALAEILGLSSYLSISHYENGFRKPSVLIAALMRLFDELPEKKSLELRESIREQVAYLKKQKRKKT